MSNLNVNSYHLLPCYHAVNGVPYSLDCCSMQDKPGEHKVDAAFYKGLAMLTSFGIAGIGIYALSKVKGLNIDISSQKVIRIGNCFPEKDKTLTVVAAQNADKFMEIMSNTVKQVGEAADAAIKNINKAVQDAFEKKANSNMAMPRCKYDRVFVGSAPTSQTFAMCA